MYNLPPFCCICFNNKEELKSINNKDCIDTQIISKLNFCSFETEWVVPDLLIYICRKCCHILDLACDFKNMCIKSNRLLRGYATQLKSASNTVENIRNELFMMFNNEKLIPHQSGGQHQHGGQQQQDAAGPSTNKLQTQYSTIVRQPAQHSQPSSSINNKNEIIMEKVKQETSPPAAQIMKPSENNKLMVQVSENVMTCFDIKSEFVNELTATCSSGTVESILPTSDTFNFELKPTAGHHQHQCSLCHKCFSRESVLTRHMLIHSGERPHHCNICNKNFTHKFNLKQHMLIHSGHKTHHCTVCDKGFIKKSDLDRHMLTHFGERIHHCSICGKSFVRKENLNQHILTHTGQKPHHCTQCTKSFLRKSDLNRHMLLCISKRNS